uniref:Uncharacterized protein n=1 Tax=Sphenodon punctatus TaxID=8508 RepID=A0A8D0GMN4_SPHPU
MFSRSGYQALPLGDFDRFQQSSIGIYGSQKGLFSFGHVQDPSGQAQNGWLSWICHSIVTALVFLLTFPISGWFALKVSVGNNKGNFVPLGPSQAASPKPSPTPTLRVHGWESPV